MKSIAYDGFPDRGADNPDRRANVAGRLAKDPGRLAKDPGRLADDLERAADDRDRETEEFLSAFDAFAQAVRRARGAPPQGGDRELTLSQYALLQGLSDREWAYVRELADDAGVTPSTATRILDALERRGIVRRIRSVNDRRAVTVKLTTLGRELLDGQHTWLRERQQSFFHALPAQEQALAPDLLVRLAQLIDELAAGPSE